MDQCKSCQNYGFLERRVTDVEICVKDLRDDLEAVKVNNATVKEQIKTMFTNISEIKNLLQGIEKKLSDWERKPSDNYDKIKMTIITTFVAGFAGWFIGQIIK